MLLHFIITLASLYTFKIYLSFTPLFFIKIISSNMTTALLSKLCNEISSTRLLFLLMIEGKLELAAPHRSRRIFLHDLPTSHCGETRDLSSRGHTLKNSLFSLYTRFTVYDREMTISE